MLTQYLPTLAATLLFTTASLAQPDATTQPLPDYPAQYHQLSIDLQPPGTNGWDLLMQIADLHREIAERHYDGAYTYHQQGMVDYTLVWDPDSLDNDYTIDTQLPRINAQIADARDSGLLDMLATLATKDNLVQPAEDTPMLSHVLPHLGALRALARLNAARMTSAARSGDTEEFTAAYEQSVWLARHVSSSAPVMIGELVGIAIEALTLERVREAISLHQIPAPTAIRLLALLALLDAQPPMPPITSALDAEQMMRLDTIARLYTDDGQGDGLIVSGKMSLISGDDADGERAFDVPATGRGSWTFATKMQVINREAEIHAAHMELIAATPQERGALGDALFQSLEQKKPLIPVGTANLLLKILSPSAERFGQTADQYTLELDATRIMLAIEAYRAQHGLPPALRALVPEFLPDVPLDPFTRAPLIYRPDPSTPLGYTLYSAGYDQQDNDGFLSPDLRDPSQALRSLGVGSDCPFVPAQ